MRRRLAVLAGCLGAVLLLLPAGSAQALQAPAFPGVDCKESPTPDMPGEGLAAFFEKAPDPLPKQEDPFAEDSRTTIYEQYGYSGLRWHTYDLGCGPDAARNPDAVIGTALSNWIINIPVAVVRAHRLDHRGRLRAHLPGRLRPGDRPDLLSPAPTACSRRGCRR